MSEEATYWNGEPCKAERVTVIVADSPDFPLYWARRFVGTERKAVLVSYNGEQFYLDDEGYTMTPEEVTAFRTKHPYLPDSYYRAEQGFPGWGWEKITKSGGRPSIPHANLSVERIVETEHDHAV